MTTKKKWMSRESGQTVFHCWMIKEVLDAGTVQVLVLILVLLSHRHLFCKARPRRNTQFRENKARGSFLGGALFLQH